MMSMSWTSHLLTCPGHSFRIVWCRLLFQSKVQWGWLCMGDKRWRLLLVPRQNNWKTDPFVARFSWTNWLFLGRNHCPWIHPCHWIPSRAISSWPRLLCPNKFWKYQGWKIQTQLWTYRQFFDFWYRIRWEISHALQEERFQHWSSEGHHCFKSMYVPYVHHIWL